MKELNLMKDLDLSVDSEFWNFVREISYNLFHSIQSSNEEINNGKHTRLMEMWDRCDKMTDEEILVIANEVLNEK